jgi:hypothetical protein
MKADIVPASGCIDRAETREEILHMPNVGNSNPLVRDLKRIRILHYSS